MVKLTFKICNEITYFVLKINLPTNTIFVICQTLQHNSVNNVSNSPVLAVPRTLCGISFLSVLLQLQFVMWVGIPRTILVSQAVECTSSIAVSDVGNSSNQSAATLSP